MDDTILETPPVTKPELVISSEDNQIKPVSSSKKKTLIILILFIIFVILIMVGGYFCYSVSKNISVKPVDTPAQTPSIIPTITGDLITPKPILTDALIKKLSNETAKPRTQFDLNTWKTFEDKEAGIRFKYPKEWGEAIKDFELPPSCSSTGGSDCSGYGYWITFSKNEEFDIGGISPDYSRGRGGCRFAGFEKNEFPSATDYCEQNKEYNIYCQPARNGLHVLTGYKIFENRENCHFYTIFTRSYYLNRPNKLISGIHFSGKFLSSNYSFVYDYFKDRSIVAFMNNLVIERKLDSDSIKNFDVIEKLFETIEEI